MTNQKPSSTTQHNLVVLRVLVLIEHNDQLLLIRGAHNKPLWANLYNAVGGHVEPGETIRDAALRETYEETGLQLPDVHMRGMVSVDYPQPDNPAILFVFTAQTATARPRHSTEGTFSWFPWDEIPRHDIMPDLPDLIAEVRQSKTDGLLFYGLYTKDASGAIRTTFTR